MSIRILSISAATLLLSASAFAATPETAPGQKPILNRADPNLIDNIQGVTVRGTAPVGANQIAPKPVLNRAAPNLNDALAIRGQVPVGAQKPAPAQKPALNRADPNLIDNIQGTTIRDQAPLTVQKPPK